MSLVAWIILLVLVIPMLGILIWVVITASLVRVPSGSLGLVMVKGRATDTTLLPGPHFVPALRRRMVEEYPSVELAYRAGAQDEIEGQPAGHHRTIGTVGTAAALPQPRSFRAAAAGHPRRPDDGRHLVDMRFQLIPEQLRLVHEQFGPNGIFGIVRDETSRSGARSPSATRRSASTACSARPGRLPSSSSRPRSARHCSG